MGLTASCSAATNTITFDGHGFETNDPVIVRAVEGGALPAPLVAGTTYYAKRLSNSAFQLSATVSGATIDLTTDGVDVVVMRDPDFDYWIGVYSRWADTSLPAHAVPLQSPIPEVVECVVADLVAKRMFNVGGQASETLKEMEVAAVAQLVRFSSGLVIRNGATASTNKAVTSALGSSSDARGWSPSGSRYLP